MPLTLVLHNDMLLASLNWLKHPKMSSNPFRSSLNEFPMPENMDFDTKTIHIGVLEVNQSTIMHFHLHCGILVKSRGKIYLF